MSAVEEDPHAELDSDEPIELIEDRSVRLRRFVRLPKHGKKSANK